MRLLVWSSGLFGLAAAACRLPWYRLALAAMCAMSGFNHGMDRAYPGKQLVRAVDRALAHGIGAALHIGALARLSTRAATGSEESAPPRNRRLRRGPRRRVVHVTRFTACTLRRGARAAK